MTFDTKVALVIRAGLLPWQGLNVAAFLASGIAAAFPDCIVERYEDGSGTRYGALCGQPILLYAAEQPGLARALDRALSRGVTPVIYTADMFTTGHDAANRAAVSAVARPALDLVGLGLRADRRVADKILDGLRFHP